MTPSRLKNAARILAQALSSSGLVPGDRVAYGGQAGLDLYPFVVACSRIGLKLTVVQGSIVAPISGTNAPKLVVCPVKPPSRGPEWASVDELRLIGRQPSASFLLNWEEHDPADEAGGLTWTIRKLRTPLSVLPARDGAVGSPGEIVLSCRTTGSAEAEAAQEYRTGHIGWETEAGRLVVAGTVADVAIRGGRAVLLSDLDAVLQQHPAVRGSLSFRECGVSPTERVISVCVANICEPELRRWLADRVDGSCIPDRVAIVPKLPAELGAEPVRAVRAMVSGEAASAAVAVMTSRRFRRSPCYKETQLRELVQSAIMSGRPLDFLMFWGCGPRCFASAPDHVALEALADLLTSVEGAAPVQARANIIFTDGHARNNGHSAAHFRSYFGSIKQAANDLNARFSLESEVWQRGGLSKETICALEQTREFETKWEAFTLKDRFVLQAGRHSRMADQVAAARHYYATCLLEREVLKAQFADSVFLTYNGPEFNECFPDLPTLYVYPGPRGRTDKPWFVHDEGAPASGTGLAVAAE